MALIIYLFLSLIIYPSLGKVCAQNTKNFSDSTAAADYDSDNDGRTYFRPFPQFNSSTCRPRNTSFQISHVPCPGKQQEHFEIGKRHMRMNNTDDAIYIQLLMPGLDKEGIEVYVDEKDQLIVEGKKGMYFENGSFRPRFVLHLPMAFLKVNEITAQMKNGVLKLQIPKTKLQQVRSSNVVSVFVE